MTGKRAHGNSGLVSEATVKKSFHGGALVLQTLSCNLKVESFCLLSNFTSLRLRLDNSRYNETLSPGEVEVKAEVKVEVEVEGVNRHN